METEAQLKSRQAEIQMAMAMLNAEHIEIVNKLISLSPDIGRIALDGKTRQ